MRIGRAFLLLAHVVREGHRTVFEVRELIVLRLEIDRARRITVFVSFGIRRIRINCYRFRIGEVQVVLVREFECERLHLAAIDLLDHLRRPRALGCVFICKGLFGREINGHITAIGLDDRHRAPFGRISDISDLCFINRVVGVCNAQHTLFLELRCFKLNLVDSLVVSHTRNGLVTGILN